MRGSFKQNSVVTQPYGRNSHANVSDFSDPKVVSKLSKGKLKDESSLNKSSHDKDDENSEDRSDSSDGHSDVFVRTKAQNHHNISSIDEPDQEGSGYMETMKHNDQNIIANQTQGPVGSSRQQSFESENKSTLEKTVAPGPAEVKRRPVQSNSKNINTMSQKPGGSSLSNSIEGQPANLIPALDLQGAKDYTSNYIASNKEATIDH